VSREPLKLRRTTKLEHPRPRISQRSIIATDKYKIPRDRCPKATESKAVGGTQPTALPSSPHTCRFLGRSSSGCRNDSEGDAIFTDTRSDQRSIAPPPSLSNSFLPRAARQCIRPKRIPLATASDNNDSADAAAMPIPMAVM
jgi:hypothetical protein